MEKYVLSPTERLLNICDEMGAKITLMVEIGELWAFEAPDNSGYTKKLGYDPSKAIRKQLVRAVKHGHDVQLHLHPQWLGARWRERRWEMGFDHYRLTDLGEEEMTRVIRRGRDYLQSLLSSTAQDYACLALRVPMSCSRTTGCHL